MNSIKFRVGNKIKKAQNSKYLGAETQGMLVNPLGNAQDGACMEQSPMRHTARALHAPAKNCPLTDACLTRALPSFFCLF